MYPSIKNLTPKCGVGKYLVNKFWQRAEFGGSMS